jgi:hypothetical protein
MLELSMFPQIMHIFTAIFMTFEIFAGRSANIDRARVANRRRIGRKAAFIRRLRF